MLAILDFFCVPYLITKTMGVKNLRVEFLERNGIKTETRAELDTLADYFKDLNILSPVIFALAKPER